MHLNQNVVPNSLAPCFLLQIGSALFHAIRLKIYQNGFLRPQKVALLTVKLIPYFHDECTFTFTIPTITFEVPFSIIE